MLSERQEKILNHLIEEYIDSAEPISSNLLKKQAGLNVSPATIRNELQELTELGYIMQPHTSAGRVPTEKGYRFFVTVTFTPEKPRLPAFMYHEIQETRQKIQQELRAAEALAQSLRRSLAMLDQAEQPARPEHILNILTIIINQGHGKPGK